MYWLIGRYSSLSIKCKLLPANPKTCLDVWLPTLGLRICFDHKQNSSYPEQNPQKHHSSTELLSDQKSTWWTGNATRQHSYPADVVWPFQQTPSPSEPGSCPPPERRMPTPKIKKNQASWTREDIVIRTVNSISLESCRLTLYLGVVFFLTEM